MTATTTREQAVNAHPNDAKRKIRIYNTLSKEKEEFKPVTDGQVGIYLCGPTVYDRAHIGHMVGPVIFDTIKRYLAYSSYKVTWVVNITDVDDKLIVKAKERGITMQQVAEENTADYMKNLAALGVDTIDHFPKATQNIDEIIRFIQTLIDQGFAYQSNGDVYFEVSKFAEYGKLSNRRPESLQGEGGEMASRKRSPGDFALWKSAKPGEPSWDSPWGAGRPGWHIECSAMSRRLLGETFDIHGGGLDLVFPHHENEIAQSQCCHGKKMAKYWVHNGLLKADASAGKVGGRNDRPLPPSLGDAQTDVAGKMSRSKGAGGLAELIARQGGERIRFFLLRTHYRSTIVFSEEGIEEAGQGLEQFYRFFKRYERITGQSFYKIAPPNKRGELSAEFKRLMADKSNEKGAQALAQVAALRASFLEAMDDDFNTGAAIGELFELVRTLNKFCDDSGLETIKPRYDDDDRGVAWAADEQFLSTCRDVLREGTAMLAELSHTLGLFRTPRDEKAGSDELVDKLMRLIIDIRAGARKNKDFATADHIRNALAEIGITLEDRAGGTDWSKD